MDITESLLYDVCYLVNVGEWYGIVEMDVHTGLLRKIVSIVDPETGENKLKIHY